MNQVIWSSRCGQHHFSVDGCPDGYHSILSFGCDDLAEALAEVEALTFEFDLSCDASMSSQDCDWTRWYFQMRRMVKGRQRGAVARAMAAV